VGAFTGLDDSGRRKQYGFIYDKGTYTILSHPDVVQSRFTNGTSAQFINNQGQVVGYYYDSQFRERSFVYEKGVYTTINIPGASYVRVAGINSRGQIAGYYGVAGMNHGFLYENGVLTTIDGPGVVDGTIVVGINDGSKIVGMYQVSTDDFFYNYLFVLSR
jgi:uncharacterized membrane protein